MAPGAENRNISWSVISLGGIRCSVNAALNEFSISFLMMSNGRAGVALFFSFIDWSKASLSLNLSNLGAVLADWGELEALVSGVVKAELGREGMELGNIGSDDEDLSDDCFRNGIGVT